MATRKVLTALLMILALGFWSGCGGGGVEHTDAHHDHDHDHDGHSHDHSHGHHHEPPHGGVPVVLGNEEFHLELLLDNSAGTLTAYVLDGHMEDFIRVAAESFEMIIEPADGVRKTLEFKAQESSRTGETVGDTSQFIAADPMLTEVTEFKVEIPAISIKGRDYAGISFNFPEGNE
jgi:hypothetical protein